MATEKRLIDANAIVVPKFNMKGRDLFNQGYCQGKTDGILEVKALAPTVDAVEVVHGEWIDEDDGDWRCSACRRLFTFDDYGDIHPIDDCGFNYCPNCGAKMDGDGNA